MHENVISIVEGAFYGSSLTKINIPNSIKSIGMIAFHGCTINNSINIPENCNLAGYAFSYTTIVGNLYIPKSVKYVNTSFLGASGAAPLKVEGTATILITEILQSQFMRCSFRELELNFEEITSIGIQSLSINNSYYQGNSLKNPYFPNVETIGNYAFDYVSKITTIKFGDKVTSIGINIARGTAVSGCYLEATTPPTISVNSSTINNERNWYVPRSAQAAYEEYAGWSDINAAGKLKFIEEL